MSQTAFIAPTHVLPERMDAPRYMDEIGNGVQFVRRKWIRSRSSWEIEVPGKQELLDPFWGLIEYAQGDRIIWFDGAGFGEVTYPTLIAEGDGTTTEFRLPHKNIYVASFVLYHQDALSTAWAPLGGDGVTMDAITATGVGAGVALKAKYRRKIKCLLRVEDNPERGRAFYAPGNIETIHHIKITLEETTL